MRRTWAFLLACVVACSGLAVACGDDDDGGGTDSGGPETGNNETGTVDGGDGGDGGGGCTFATYVIGLVNTQTNATAQPDKTLGAGCKDTTTQAEFKPLFP